MHKKPAYMAGTDLRRPTQPQLAYPPVAHIMAHLRHVLIGGIVFPMFTAACLGTVAWLFLWARRQHAGTEIDRWVRAIALAGLGLAGIAILWQGLPALLA